MAWQLPKDTKKYLNFNFKNNLKLTYNFELEYASYLMKYMQNNDKHKFDNVSDKSYFTTSGLRNYLLRVYPKETRQFLNDVYQYYEELVNKYGKFKNIVANQSSR